MPVTYSRAGERGARQRRRQWWRVGELAGLLVAGLLVSAALWQVYGAKTRQMAGVEAGLASRQLLDLNNLNAREDLLPALGMFQPQAKREDVAQTIAFGRLRGSRVGRPPKTMARPTSLFPFQLRQPPLQFRHLAPQCRQPGQVG